MTDLRELVFSALDNALEGGYDMSGYTRKPSRWTSRHLTLMSKNF